MRASTVLGGIKDRQPKKYPIGARIPALSVSIAHRIADLSCYGRFD